MENTTVLAIMGVLGGLLGIIYSRPLRRIRIVVASPECSSLISRRITTTCSAFMQPPIFLGLPGLLNPHVNTLLNFLRPVRPVTYHRQPFVSPHDGGLLQLDVCEAVAGEAHGGTMMILPGLSSHSRSGYIQNFVREASTNGWRCVVVNARGVGGSPLTTPQVYCAAWTTDARDVAKYLRTQQQHRNMLVGVGFSLGANVLALMMGQDGYTCVLDAGASVCNPWDLMYSSSVLPGVYSRAFTKGLIAYVKDHWESQLKKSAKVELSAVVRCRSVRQFDNDITAQLFGYKDADDYYTNGSSLKVVGNIAVPLFVLDATDDPIVGSARTEAQWQRIVNENPNVHVMRVDGGGHIGFLDAATIASVWGSSWADKVLVKTLSQLSALY